MKKEIEKRLDKIEKKIKKKVGRPTVLTKDVLNKLEASFSVGANNREACISADLVEGTFYKHLKENPEYIERIKLLRAKLPLKAKKLLAEDMDSFDKALKYLKNVSSDEFSEKTISDGKVEYNINCKVKFVTKADVEKEKKKII